VREDGVLLLQLRSRGHLPVAVLISHSIHFHAHRWQSFVALPEDAAEHAVRMVKEWIPPANEYAEKKNATHGKRRHTIETHRKAAEEEQKKRLGAVTAKLNALNKKLNSRIQS
jgi:hypothetical protein